MRPQVRPLITVFAAVLILISCSTDDPSQPGAAIHQSYEIEYDVARDRTTGRAALRVDNASGAQTQLGSPAGILYNGTAMSFSNVEPFGYERIQNGRIASGTFEYTDGTGTVKTNTALIASVETIALPSGVNALTMSTGAEIVWEGAAVGIDETVLLIFSTPSAGVATYFQQSVGATSITLSSAHLTQLGAGVGTWRLERLKTMGLQAPTTAGGSIGVRWSTGDSPVTIN
ncbi:MAG: hypothetical protein SGJ05_12460 [bacterium]|nr:hypothetical protein [bacterium]